MNPYEPQTRNDCAPETTPATMQTIGVVADEFTNPHTLHMLKEVTHQLNQRGCITRLLNVDSEADYQSVLNMVVQRPVDGLLLLAARACDELLATVKERQPIPVVLLGRDAADSSVPVVSVAGFAAGQEMGNLLLSQGFQRFGYLCGARHTARNRQRRDGYVHSLEQGGKTLNQVLVADRDDRESGWQAMMACLKSSRASERIDALLCESDVLAFGAMQAIRDFGQGTHIGVASFDDVPEAGASMFSLTTWAARGDLLIAEALSRLLDNRADENGAWRHGELKIRHSHLSREVHGEMAKCGCASRH